MWKNYTYLILFQVYFNMLNTHFIYSNRQKESLLNLKFVHRQEYVVAVLVV